MENNVLFDVVEYVRLAGGSAIMAALRRSRHMLSLRNRRKDGRIALYGDGLTC